MMKPIPPDLRGNAQKVLTKAPEVVLTFKAGDIIFSKGDPGGDLLFIESGAVEIFIPSEKQSIVLARMVSGEIIGVMTFLTRDARLASARAVETTTIKQISSTHVQRYIATFPKWLNIVLKEFVGRINDMNRMYSETTVALKQARELQITPLFLATQLAQSIGIVGKGMAKNQEAGGFVNADELGQKMQLVLNQPKDMIDGLMRVFVETGLIFSENDPERKQRAFKVAVLDRASIFTQFVRESTQGSTKKILRARLSAKELGLLKALGSMMVRKSLPEDKSGTLKFSEIHTEIQSMAGIEFDTSLIEKASKLGLIVVKEDGANSAVTLTPATVMRTVSCIEAMRRLTSEVDGFEEMTDIAGEDAA